jgi:hypothetical protein
MSESIFPLAFANEDFRLLTGLLLGFLFGFALERGGFGNARKLAAQFYGHDMAVFKVMFSAILVAMVGLFTFAKLGWMSLDGLFINPTFMGAQVVGGFLLGIGFLISGLCPGTAIVSAASGRWDGVVAFLGISIGAVAFIVLVDFMPPLYALYNSGSMGTSLLPDVFGMSPLTLTAIIAVGAGIAFVGAEKAEVLFRKKYGMVELTRLEGPTGKFILSGVVAALAVVGVGLQAASAGPAPVEMASLSPLALAEEIIEGTPGMMMLDLRAEGDIESRIPGSYPAADVEAALSLVAAAPFGSTVVLIGADGPLPAIPDDWPRTVNYASLEDGFAGWVRDVMTPVEAGRTQESRAWSNWQNQIAAFFSGTAAQLSDAPPPPPATSGGGSRKKPKGGGC